MANNTVTTLLTVPAGKKFEVTVVSLNQLGGVAYWMQLLWLPSGGSSHYIETFRLPSTENAWCARFNAIVLNVGDKLLARGIAASGSGAIEWYVAYVEVDL